MRSRYTSNVRSLESFPFRVAEGGLFSYTCPMLDALRETLLRDGTVSFSVRARPGASASRITSVLDDGSVKIDVAAPAEEGKANAALVRFLAEAFAVATKDVSILAGGGGRKKIVRISRS